MFRRALIKIMKSVLDGIDIDITDKRKNPNKAEGYPSYLKKAESFQMDVNDYIEKYEGWLEALPILKKIVFPVLDNMETPVVIELGVGTGRWSRHIIERINNSGGELHLIDHSPWIVDFLSTYFNDEPKIVVHLCDGNTIPIHNGTEGMADLIFSQGTFIELKLDRFYTYSREFYRVLKPGGVCIFDFIDIDTEDGWNYMVKHAESKNCCYTFHKLETVNRIFKSAGLSLIDKHYIGKSTYVMYKKK